MICLSASQLVFDDPAHGPISLWISVWRKAGAELLEYQVVVQ